MVLADDLASVGHTDPHMTCFPSRNMDVDIGALETILDSVFDQVVKHLVDFVRKAVHNRTAWPAGPVVNQNDTHLAARGAALEAGNNGFHDVEQRHPFVRNDMLVDLDPRQGQQIIDQP